MKGKNYSAEELSRMGVAQRARHINRMEAEKAAAAAPQQASAPQPSTARPLPLKKHAYPVNAHKR